MKRPPAAFAGGGLDAARWLNQVRQAPFPACVLEPLIRREGIDTAMHRTGEKLAVAAEVCMTFFAVEQRSRGTSRDPAQAPGQAHLNFSHPAKPFLHIAIQMHLPWHRLILSWKRVCVGQESNFCYTRRVHPSAEVAKLADAPA